MDLAYTFHDTANNGQITKAKDHRTGEEVNYTYDSLTRLIAASTTGPEWGLSFAYDGFGDRTAQTVTKGTAPTFNARWMRATNRLVGWTYDASLHSAQRSLARGPHSGMVSRALKSAASSPARWGNPTGIAV